MDRTRCRNFGACMQEPDGCLCLQDPTMTPQETADAFDAMVKRGEQTQFDRMCSQLYRGQLVLRSMGEEGFIIRAAELEDEDEQTV